MSEVVDLTLIGLQKDSLQGDSVIAKIARFYGVNTEYNDNSIRLTLGKKPVDQIFEYNFVECPDIAQSVSVMTAGMNISCLFSGLQTLKIKETDRITALKIELKKVRVSLSMLPQKFSRKSEMEYYLQQGTITGEDTPVFETYKDHRMAMAFAPLAIIFPIEMEEHMVVTKSYPRFWKDIEKLGFEIESI